MSLYKEVQQLNDEVMALIEALNNNPTPEETQELSEKLVAVAEARDYMQDQSCEEICKARQNCMADNEAIDAELKRLQARKANNKKAIEFYENELLRAVELRGGKFMAGTFSIGTRKSTVVVVDETIFNDDRFKSEEVTIKIDKMAIKAALKDGEVIAGAELVDKQNIAIK
ncbi:MAG: siphovirus Gp157 family protein [Clostridia bacterium]|nr:siphovirus Gp157 family protein [Clostridia bacterium]